VSNNRLDECVTDSYTVLRNRNQGGSVSTKTRG